MPTSPLWYVQQAIFVPNSRNLAKQKGHRFPGAQKRSKKGTDFSVPKKTLLAISAYPKDSFPR